MRVYQVVVIVGIHDKVGATRLRHVAHSVFHVVVPPRVLPVGVVQFAAALQLVLDEVKVLRHARVVGLAVGFERVLEEFSHVDGSVVTIEKYERDSGHF